MKNKTKINTILVVVAAAGLYLLANGSQTGRRSAPMAESCKYLQATIYGCHADTGYCSLIPGWFNYRYDDVGTSQCCYSGGVLVSGEPYSCTETYDFHCCDSLDDPGCQYPDCPVVGPG